MLDYDAMLFEFDAVNWPLCIHLNLYFELVNSE
jgi:hypothetical protein